MFKVGDKVFLYKKGSIDWEISHNYDILSADNITINKFYKVKYTHPTDQKISLGSGMYWHHPEHFKLYKNE